MLLVLGLLAAALRSGAKIRGARLRRTALPRDARRRHLRVAKPAVLLACVGFVGGPLSAYFLRGWTPFSTLHAVLGALAALLLVVAGIRGLALEGAGGGVESARLRAGHARLALAAVAVSALAAFAGFVLLP